MLILLERNPAFVVANFMRISKFLRIEIQKRYALIQAIRRFGNVEVPF